MQVSRVGGGGRSRVVLVGRIALSAGLLAFLVTRVHLHALIPKWQHSAAWWVSGGLLVTLAGVVLSTVRWQRALAAAVFAAAHPRLGGRLADNAGWLRFAGAIHLGVDKFRRSPGRVAEVMLVAAGYQLAMLTAAWMAAEALGLHLGWTVFLVFFP